MNGVARFSLRAGARVLGARMRFDLRRAQRSHHAQERTLRRLLAGYARTRYGREHGLERDMDYGAFCDAAPIATYENFLVHIERMCAGARDELWPGLCRYFAASSGTTAGPSKLLPVTDGMLEHFRRAGLQSLLLYTSRVHRTDVLGGRHLFLGGATSLQRLTPAGGPEIFSGDLSGIMAAHLPGWSEALLYEPGRAIALIDDWPCKIEAIVTRTLRRDIRLVAGIPSWLLVLFSELERRAKREGIAWRGLRSIWPRLECIVHGGVPVEPYADQLHAFTGPDVAFHEVFPASEGFIAAQDGASGEGLQVLDAAGLFYEFLPLEELDEDGKPRARARALPLHECETGTHYALVLSTPAGLCRYLIGDIVRLVSLEPARLVYAGRTTLQLSAFGEHVIENELTTAIVAAAREQSAQVLNFHAAPLFPNASTHRARGCHEWWIECASGEPEVSRLCASLDEKLQRLNDDYAAKRRGGGLAAPIAHLVRPGFFESWQKSRGRWGGQNKVPRCRSDRRIAHEFAALLGEAPRSREPDGLF